MSVELTPTEVRIVHEQEPLVYQRAAERHRVIGWEGAPRVLPPGAVNGPTGEPPRFDPSWLARVGQVTARPLDAYAALAAEVLS